MSETKKMKIVWAVDPLGEVKAFQEAAARTLQSFQRNLDFEIHPIHLYGGYPLDFQLYSAPELTAADEARVRDAYSAIVKDIPLRDAKNVEFVVSPYVTLREGVGRLSARAEAIGADLIVATTHARQGVTRWLIGSFAEALLESSDVPVLILNPEETGWKPESVVFATDFSEVSHEAFRKFLPIARGLKAEVQLYHKITHVASPVLATAVAALLGGSSPFTDHIRAMNDLAREWKEEARQAGVSVEAKVDVLLPRTPADAVLEEAAKVRGWIAIAARGRSGLLGGLGSVARRVIRGGTGAVWVYRRKGM